MEPTVGQEAMYESYKEGLDGLPETRVSIEVRLLADGEEIFTHEYLSESMLEEDRSKRERMVQNYRKELLAEQFGETD